MKRYYDIDEIMKFVFDNNYEQVDDSEIMEVYAMDEEKNALALVNKQINETKNARKDSDTAIRYDLIKTFIGMLAESQIDEVSKTNQEIVYNGLVMKNIIKETE